MFRRLALFLLIGCLVIPFSLPRTTIAAQGTSFQEGAFLQISRGFTIANQQVRIQATKTITRVSGGRTTRVSVFELSLSCFTFSPDGVVIEPITIEVPIDPDYLSVSRDLGWAGLDAVVNVFNQLSQSTIPVEIHAYWWANTGVTEGNGLFKRGARLEGRITTPKCAFDLSAPPGNANSVTAYIFSTREPQPRY